MIVSASRREDVPAYRMAWFLERLREGSVLVPNPFDASRPRLVSLDPEDIDCLVFWTRDPRPLLARAGEVEERGIGYFVHETLTGYPRSLEPGVPETNDALCALEALSERIGPARLAWRYDPLLLGALAGGPDLDRDFHLRNFEALARRIAGRAGRVVLSAMDAYRNTARRLAAAGFRAEGLDRPRGEPSPAYASLIAELAALAESLGLEASACAETGLGLRPRACIDAGELAGLFGFEPPPAKARADRAGCACSRSVDIGSYGACRAGCVYCYARR